MFHLVSSFVLIVTQWPASGSSALIGYGGRFTARIVFEETKKAAANATLAGGPFLTSFLRKRRNEVPENS
jgi:hypothetical protein